ncbi:MAG: serine/threonine-protein kinase [Acidobacteriota bacterium]
MTDPVDRLVDLAGSVSDGADVDWEGEEQTGEVRGLEGLKTLSRVASAFSAAQDRREEHHREEHCDVLFRWGPLEALEKLGEGQFGEVFRAWDPQVGRQVALKLSRSEGSLLRSWLAEAKRLASVRHPNVLTIFGAAVHNGRAGIWTDLLTGKTLEHRLERDGPLGASELVAVGCELCRALAAVHGAGLVHGDVKPSNVVRGEHGQLVLVDFGAARATAEALPILSQGTPSYLAPEIAAGSPTTASSDLFALGALLWRLATGRHPSEVEASDLRALRPDLSSGLVETIDALLAEAPANRPASAGDAESRLLTSQTEAAAPRRATSRRGWQLAALAATLAMLLAGALLLGPWPQVTDAPLAAPFQADLWNERGDTAMHLTDGTTVRPGDHLALRVQVEESTHVYVFNEDDEGHLFVLFPLPELVPANPLTPGVHRLPGQLAGQPQSWEVTSAGGKERFLIVGSRNALPELERLRERQQPARRNRPIEHAATEPREILRGVGGLQSSSLPGASVSRLSQLHDELVNRPSAIWAKLLVLDNPP